jgi:actin-related protein
MRGLFDRFRTFGATCILFVSGNMLQQDPGVGVVIIDNGTGTIKAGMSSDNDDGPSFIFPSIVGKKAGETEYFVGNDAEAKSNVLDIEYPIQNGVIENWDSMEKLWNHTFANELKVSPEEHRVILTEVPLNPAANREKMAQIMFEKFNVPSLSIVNQAFLSLISSGRTYGIVLQSGDAGTFAVPILEGKVLEDQIKISALSGKLLTSYMQKLLLKEGHKVELKMVKEVKEKVCYVTRRFDEEVDEILKASSVGKIKNDYLLPDDQVITLGDSKIKCPEALFQPDLVGLEEEGIASLVYNSIWSCHVDLRRDLWLNIVLAGGNTMFRGLDARLQRDLNSLFPPTVGSKVVAPLDRNMSSWIGGNILATLCPVSIEEMVCSKKDYEEIGPSAIHKKPSN